MSTDGEQTPGTAFTNKEMWVRVDAKLDTLVSRQQHFDVELALLKERQHQHEVALAAHDAFERSERDSVKKELQKAEELMAGEVQALKEGQFSISRAVKYASGVVVGVLILVDVTIRFFQ
jgi:hypothetical protein